MLRGLFEGWHIWVILLVVIILFGAPKLPGLAKSVGQSLRIFKHEVKDLRDDDDTPASSGTEAAPLEGTVEGGTAKRTARPESDRTDGQTPRSTPPAS